VVPPGTTLNPAPGTEVAREMLGLPVRGPVVAYVGRVTAIKRPDRFVEVVRQVRATVPDAVFVVCGDGDRLDHLADAAARMDGGIRLLGWRGDVETVYAAADLTLLTSDNEGMPVSLIESALAGVPVVATDVGSVAEVVVDGGTGLLAPCSADALAGHVTTLLGDHARRLAMGRQARAHASERFGTDRLVADTRDLYTQIAAAHGWLRSREDVHR
jgi:glycosyltransferase involved in cell wall biosynthesis